MIAVAVALALLVGILAVYAFPNQTASTTTPIATSTTVVTSSEVATSTSVVTVETTVTQQMSSTTTSLTKTASTTGTVTSTSSLTSTVETMTTVTCAPLGPAVCGGLNILNASLVANETTLHSSQTSAYLSLTAVNAGNVQITWLNVTLSGTPVFFASMTWLPGTSVTLSLPVTPSESAVNPGQVYQLLVNTNSGAELINVTAT